MLDKIKALLAALGRRQLLVGGIVVVLLYAWFISNLSTHPGGSYLDESCQAYNAYLIAKTGTAENGTSYPLFFQCYTQGLTQWMSPVLMYSMSAMYLIVPPSVVSARIFSATVVFLATLLLGLLAFKISGRRLIGFIVAVTAMATPWLFEISRLIQETSVLAFSIILFFYCLHNAHKREQWKLTDNILIGVSLGLITYSYAAGRVLAPAFAFGLLIFAVNWKAFLEVIKTWVVFLITLIPFIIVYLTNGSVISARFREVSYVTPDTPWSTVAQNLISYFFQDISPTFLLFAGDPLHRHHIPVMGEIFIVTFLLAIAGLILILLQRRSDAWWRFVLYGLIVAVIPGAITTYRHHALRLLALPIILLILTVPALSWLLGDREGGDKPGFWLSVKETIGSLIPFRTVGRVVLGVLMTLTLVQAVYFHLQFREIGSKRSHHFDVSYPSVLNAALADESRPIYLKDGYWGPAYIHAYWYAAIQGIDPSNFVHLKEREAPPVDSLVLSSDNECTSCEKVMQDGAYLLYRKLGPNSKPPPPVVKSSASGDRLKNPTVFGVQETDGTQYGPPRGIVSDLTGNIYLADTGKGSLQKLDPDGKVIMTFGVTGAGEGELKEPNGVALDTAENIYVTDAGNHKLIKFDKDGNFLKEWKAPGLNFYGPRDISIGPNGQLYIIDQGNNRIVVFNPATETFSSWGSVGSEEGQLGNPTGIGIGDKLVFVADAANNRIQVFDLEGKFIRQWPVPAWNAASGHYPDAAYDEKSKSLFVSNGIGNEIMAFNIDGGQIDNFKSEDKNVLNNPSSLIVSEKSKKQRLIVLNVGRRTATAFEMVSTK